MAFTTTTAAEILKIDYRQPMVDLLNNSNYWLKRLEKTKKNYKGKVAYVSLHNARNNSFRSGTEGGNYPTPGQQGYTHAEYGVKILMVSIELSNVLMAAATGGAASFVDALQSEMKGAAKDARSNMNRIAFHDGSSILTDSGVTSASLTYVVSSTKYLKAGMVIDIVVRSTGAVVTNGAARTIQSVGSATTVVLDTAGGVVTTDATSSAIISGSRQLAGVGVGWAVHQDPWGLEALCAAANPGNGITDLVGTITRTAQDWWQANVVAGSSLDSSTIALWMQKAWDTTEIALDEQAGIIMTNHASRRTYGSSLTPDKRYPAGAEKVLDGGYRALEFNGIPVVADKDCNLTNTPAAAFGKMYFLVMDSFCCEQLKDWDWVEAGGSTLHLKSGSNGYADSMQAFMRAYQEFSVSRPQANTILTGITES